MFSGSRLITPMPMSTGALTSEQMQQQDEKTNSCQIVHIEQTSPVVQINLPGLMPSYTNVSTRDRPVRYQLQYFDFPQEQVNVYAGENIYMFVELAFVPSLSDPTTLEATSVFLPVTKEQTLGFPLQFPQTQYMSCDDFAAYVNQTLLGLSTQLEFLFSDQATENSTQFWETPLDAHYLANMHKFLMHFRQFAFDSTTQRYTFIMLPNTSASFTYVANEYSSSTGIQGYLLLDAAVYFAVDPFVTAERQLQLARLIGANQAGQYILDDYTDVSSTFNGVNESSGGGDVPAFYRASYQLGTYLSATTIAQSPYIAPYVISFESGGSVELTVYNNLGSYFLYGDQLPIASLTEYVYLRTSSDTKTWDNNEGSKTNLLMQIPWRAAGSIPQLAEQYLQTNNYAVVDSLNSLRSMQIMVTDSNGTLLNLTKDFIIKIAIFTE